MDTNVEALEGNQVKLTVTIDAAEIDKRIGKTYKDFAHKYNFPGFRKGKAPRPIIDNALGAEAVLATVTDEVVNETYPLAVDDSLIYPISQPKFEDQESMVEGGKPFSYSVTLDVKPELELSDYSAPELELPAEGATDEEIEEQIDALREHYFSLEDATAATKVAEDSSVELSLAATDAKGEPIEELTSESQLYTLGSGMYPGSFDQELIGMKKGQKKSIDVDFTEGIAADSADGEGKTHFDVEVIAVKKKVLPEANDEWAKESGFEDMADLRARIAESIVSQKQGFIPRMKENGALVALSTRLEGDVPDSLVEANETELLKSFFQQIQAQGMTFDMYLTQQGLTSDQFREDIKQQANEMTRQDLALDAWARHRGIAITSEDITEEFTKSGVEDPKALEEEWRANGRLYSLREGIMRMRATEDLLEQVVVKEIGSGDGKKEPAKAAKAKSSDKETEDKKPAAKKTAAKKADADASADDKEPAKKTAAKATKATKATEATEEQE